MERYKVVWRILGIGFVSLFVRSSNFFYQASFVLSIINTRTGVFVEYYIYVREFRPAWIPRGILHILYHVRSNARSRR